MGDEDALVASLCASLTDDQSTSTTSSAKLGDHRAEAVGTRSSTPALCTSNETLTSFTEDMLALRPEDRLAALLIPAFEVSLLRDLSSRLEVEVADSLPENV